MTKQITVYSTPTCPYCTKVKEWLNTHNIQFNDINVAEDHEAAKKMVSNSGQTGVPVLEVNEGEEKRIIIGFNVEALEQEFP